MSFNRFLLHFVRRSTNAINFLLVAVFVKREPPVVRSTTVGIVTCLSNKKSACSAYRQAANRGETLDTRTADRRLAWAIPQVPFRQKRLAPTATFVKLSSRLTSDTCQFDVAEPG